MKGRNPLARLRTDAGLSQRAAAERFGITYQHLCDVECGKRLPGERLVESMAQVYGADVRTVARTVVRGWAAGRTAARLNELRGLAK